MRLFYALLALAVVLAAVAGCGPSASPSVVAVPSVGPSFNTPNQCIRRKAFEACLTKAPQGPRALNDTDNDWAAVVNACAQAAFYLSIQQRTEVPAACVGWKDQ